MNMFLNNIKTIVETLGNEQLLLANNIYLRVLSIICLAFGGWFWVRLVGAYSGDLWRVDLMPGQWQILVIALAIICPIAAVGLWFGALWGIILWIITALAQIIAFTIYSSQFTFMPFTALFQLLLLLIFLAFNGIIFYKKKQKSITLTEF